MRGIATVHSITIAGLLAGLALFTTGCNKLNARDNLNQGVNAFKTGAYSEAADHFKTAQVCVAQEPANRARHQR